LKWQNDTLDTSKLIPVNINIQVVNNH
jgi:hypothetical protein